MILEGFHQMISNLPYVHAFFYVKNQLSPVLGPLEPNKRQFSSLSLCPTCGKVYLGYRRMAIHFQKFPDHKNEELLKRLLDAKKKSFDESVLLDNSEINTSE